MSIKHQKVNKQGRSTVLTKKLTKISNFKVIIVLIPDWLHENGVSQIFEDLPIDDLAEVLRQSYGTVLSKNKKEYSKSGLKNLHSDLNRHLHSPPHSKNFDLMNDHNFLQANLVFTGRLKDNKEKDLDTTVPHTAMEKDLDTAVPHTAMEKEDLQNYSTVILQKLWVMTWTQKYYCTRCSSTKLYYTGRCGKEGLRNLSKNSFTIEQGPTGKEYIDINFNECMQGDTMSATVNALHNDHHVITEIFDSILCPVSSFKMYL